MTEVWAHGTVLQPEPSSASEARDFVCLQLIEHKLLHLVEDIRLVASEFATIAMVYTRAPFTLRLERMNDLIRLTVVEGSPPLPVRASANIIDSSRQSMSVVEVVSQSWGMDPNPTGTRTLWACFTVDPGSSNPCRQRGALRPKPVIERSRIIEPAAG